MPASMRAIRTGFGRNNPPRQGRGNQTDESLDRTLDRKVAKGEIEATYLDRRVRFKVTEIQRFIDLRTGRPDRKRP